MDDRFDRAYSYDESGRLAEAYAGGQARDFVGGVTNPPAVSPYRQSYHYDEYDRLTGRESRYWGRNDDFAAQYEAVTGRNQSWQYDAGGGVRQDETLSYRYEAAGGVREVRALDNSKSATQWADGGGLIVRREEREPATAAPSTNYYLRSSVMGGAVVAELNSTGQRAKGYVHLGGRVLAEQVGGVVTWRHEDPVTGSLGRSYSDGRYEATAEVDAGGVNVGVDDPVGGVGGRPYAPDPETPSFDSGAGDHLCILDGLTTDCATVMSMLGGGAASPCPGNDCGPQARTINGVSFLTTPFMAFANGVSGYFMPGYAGMGTPERQADDYYDVLTAMAAGATTGIDGSGGHPSANPTTQNPLQPPPDVAGIRAEFDRMLRDLKCASFIKDLLGRVSNAHKENPLVEGGDIIKIFDLINSPQQAGMIRDGAPGSYRDSKGRGGNYALGSIGGNNARIQLGTLYSGIPTAKIDAVTALHETIHHAGKNVYNDGVLAEAIKEKTGIEITGADGSPLTGNWEEDKYRYSYYWDKELKANCK